MAEMLVLEATKRTVIGKHVRHLRRNGIIPGVLYGPEFEPVQVQMPWVELRAALLAAGGSQIIELKVDGEPYTALVRNVQRRPLRSEVLHVDFYRVRMDVAIRTEVPVVLKGSVEAFEKLGGAILHEMNSVLVECLPTDLPAEVPVDISVLKQIGDVILASALPVLPGVTYHVEPNEVVVTTTYLERAAEEEVVAPEEAEPELIRRRPEEEEEEEV
jgi:large subunit ribosomal protein L25